MVRTVYRLNMKMYVTTYLLIILYWFRLNENFFFYWNLNIIFVYLF
jgi:hypothetical protein